MKFFNTCSLINAPGNRYPGHGYKRSPMSGMVRLTGTTVGINQPPFDWRKLPWFGAMKAVEIKWNLAFASMHTLVDLSLRVSVSHILCGDPLVLASFFPTMSFSLKIHPFRIPALPCTILLIPQLLLTCAIVSCCQFAQINWVKFPLLHQSSKGPSLID